MNGVQHPAREIERHQGGLWAIRRCGDCRRTPFQLWAAQNGEAVLVSFHSTDMEARLAAEAYEAAERVRGRRWPAGRAS